MTGLFERMVRKQRARTTRTLHINIRLFNIATRITVDMKYYILRTDKFFFFFYTQTMNNTRVVVAFFVFPLGKYTHVE